MGYFIAIKYLLFIGNRTVWNKSLSQILEFFHPENSSVVDYHSLYWFCSGSVLFEMLLTCLDWSLFAKRFQIPCLVENFTDNVKSLSEPFLQR